MVRIITTRAELVDVLQAGHGFIYNDFGGRKPEACPIHEVGCASLVAMTNVEDGKLAIKKFWSEVLSELVDYVEAKGKVYRMCGNEPDLLGAKSPPTQRPFPEVPMRIAQSSAYTGSIDAIGASSPSAPFHITGGDPRRGPLECWSESRLQFEPKGWMVEMRAELRRHLGGYVATPNEVLRAVYSSPSSEVVDTENVLTYNIGAASFSGTTRRGLVFERLIAPCPPVPLAMSYTMSHHMRFELVAPEPEFRYWRAGATIASWKACPCPPLSGATKPAAVWLAAKQHGTMMVGEPQPVGATFGLRLRVHPGSSGAPSIASLIKPLIDGIIASLHQHDGSDLATLSDRLGRALGRSPEELGALLMAK